MDDSEVLLKRIAGKSNVRVELGYYRALDFPRAVIDVGGGRIPAEFATAYEPEVNEQVQVLWVDGKPFVIGPAKLRPSMGVVVTAPVGNKVTIDTDIGQITATYNADIALSSGTAVRLHWGAGPYVMSRMSTQPDVPIDPGAGGTAGVNRQETFTATNAGAWQVAGGRWSSDQPRASNGYLGAWFFGSKIRDTVAASAQMVSVEVYVKYASRFGSPPNFAMHSQAVPGGVPDLSAEFAWAVNDGWNRLPHSVEATYFDALKAGGPALGIGLKQGGVNRFVSLGEDAQSGAIRITWRT